MLYHLYEAQRAALMPMRYFAQQSQQFFSYSGNPVSHTGTGRIMAAALDMFEQTTRTYGKPAFGLHETTVRGQRVAVQEEIHARMPFGQLKHFHRVGEFDQPRLLIVAPMSGHFATLLRGTVEALLPDHDVWITDWRDARHVPVHEGGFDLDDYVDAIINWLDYLGPNTHVMAVCQPAVPVTGAIALMSAMDHPATPSSFTIMGGPIDTRINPTIVNTYATDHDIGWFENNVISLVPAPNAGFMRRVYPGFMQLAGFMAMNLSSHVKKHADMFMDLVQGDGESAAATRAFYEEYRSVVDLPADYYLQTLETVFLDHKLPRGVWSSRDREIDPSAIEKTAVLTIEGEMDDITGPGQTRALHDLLTNLPQDRRAHFEAPGVGHYGVFHGNVWRDMTAPLVRDFILAHDRKTA